MANQPISAARVFEHAECFHQATAALRGIWPDRGLTLEHHENIHAAVTLLEPLIVLGALTTELFLKCLICIERPDSTPPRDHNLKRLFDELSDTTRTRIRNLWDNDVVARRCKDWDRVETFGLKVARDLPSALAKGDEAFQRYRYSYEGNTDGLHYYLEDLSALLENVILELKPELEAFRRAPLPLKQGFSSLT